MKDLLEIQWKDSIQNQGQSNPETWKPHLEEFADYDFIEIK